MADAPPWTTVADGLVVTIRLTPKGGRDAIDGIAQLADGRGIVKVRVRAAPSEGAANAALIRLMAETFDTARRNVSLTAGAAARIKQVKIAGDGVALAARLDRRLRNAP